MLSKNVLILIALSIFLTPLGLLAQTTDPTPTPTPSDADEVIKVDVALVNIPVVVSDKQGRSITGLTADKFVLFHDGSEKKIEYLSTQDTPLHVVLLLDTSRSAVEIVEKIKNAATKFIKQLNPADRCMVINFDDKAQVATEFSANPKRLEKAIQRIEMSNSFGTLMRDTVYATVDKELRKVRGRKAIILLTDGKDAGSSVSKNSLLDRLVESDAPIYSIFYETVNVMQPIPTTDKSGKIQQAKLTQKQLSKNEDDQRKKNIVAAEFLQKMSDISGGRIFPKEIDNLDEAFKSVADELRKQYLISFYPDEENYDLTKHQIKVRVSRPDVVVRLKNVNLAKR